MLVENHFTIPKSGQEDESFMNDVAENVDGSRGGGRPDMAQAGGQNIKKIDFALEKLKNFIKERI